MALVKAKNRIWMTAIGLKNVDNLKPPCTLLPMQKIILKVLSQFKM